jgi:UDP-2,3-diacylglucosamine pyrophosphatase LpxH
MRATRRLIVISDLHLGGDSPRMMSRPTLLASFIEGVPARLREKEQLDLVIAGDFVDFLAMPPHAAWTPEPAAARSKLEATMGASSPFAPVFDALGRHVHSGHRLTVLVGNHDVELTLPAVQEALLARLDASPHDVLFVDDGRAYRVGGALLEHGNRYDGANVNDWDGLRTIASAQSRGEDAPVELEVSAGSVIVERVINALKGRYPFIDLLQPEGEVVALLLFAFEPRLLADLDKIGRMINGKRKHGENPEGNQPGKTRNVAAAVTEQRDPELAKAFGPAYDAVRSSSSSQRVGAVDWLSIYAKPWEDSLSTLLAKSDPLPSDRLQKIRVALRHLLLGDLSDRSDGPTEQYGKAAERLRASGNGVETVLMGHTHLPRHIGPPERATYINTGTWVDRMRVPSKALEDGQDTLLEEFLRALIKDKRSPLPPTYGDVTVDADGRVRAATLETVTP